MAKFQEAVRQSLEEQVDMVEEDDSKVSSAGHFESEETDDDLAMPEWVDFPEDLKAPPGRQVLFVRFKAEWTQDATKGDRHCILWSLSTSDEQFAMKRSQGIHARFMPESTKQMIRAFDGKIVDWTGASKKTLMLKGRSSVDQFWEEIGPKCRQQLTNLYVKLHHMNAEDEADFFLSCFAVRSAVGG